MQDHLEKIGDSPIHKQRLVVMIGLMCLSLIPSLLYLAYDSSANFWSSPVMTPLALALCPLVGLPLLFIYGLASRIPNQHHDQIALVGLLPCLLLTVAYGATAFFSLSQANMDIDAYLSNQQINSFSRSFILCLVTVFMLNRHDRNKLSSPSKIWIMPVALVIGLGALQLLDLRMGLFTDNLHTIVGITSITSIFNIALLTKIGWEKQKPILLCLGWAAALQLANQLLYLLDRPTSGQGQLLLTQNCNDILAFLIPVPFLARNILRQMTRQFSSIPSANQIQDTEGLQSSEAFAKGVAQAKSQLLSKLSHEFKTPLNTIIGYSELLVSELEEAQLSLLSDDMHKVNRAGWYLMTLVDDLLDVSSLEGNALKMRENSFDAERFMQVLHKIAKRVAGPYMIEVESFCQKDFGMVRADEARLLQVCMNILRNSARYTNDGQISLHFYSIIKDSQRFFTIDIKDSGRGMDAQELSRIFTAFECIQGDPWESIYGISLGLPVTKRLCEMMGGSLTVNSVPGKGTTFSLTFPHSGNAEQPRTEKSHSLLADGPILLIDDDVEYTGFMREIFESAGLSAYTCSHARSGLRIYLEKKPSVILVDLKMPDIDGFSVIQSIRDQDPDCLIITISGEGLEGSDEQSKLAGSDQFFAKPMAVEAVLRSIEMRKKPAA